MKSNILTLAFVLLSIFNYSQKVKVKKGEIQIDGKSVAKIHKEKGVFTISDLSGEALFTAIITNKTPLKNSASKTWLQLTGTNGVVRELDLIPSNSIALGFERPILENLTLSEDPLLPASGIDKDKITGFFQNEDRSVSKAVDMLIEKEKAIIRREDSIANANKLFLDKAGVIIANNKQIGYLIRKEIIGGKEAIGNIKNFYYSVLDINRIPVAQVDFSDINNGLSLILKTFDQKTFPIKPVYAFNKIDYENLTTRIIRRLYANGYTLGDMSAGFNSLRTENRKELEDKAEATFGSIYNTAGYVIDKKGVKHEGNITIEFGPIEPVGEKNVIGGTAYGTYLFLNSNGKSKTYKAKDGVKFCVGDRCFLGATGSEDGGTGNNSGSTSSLIFDESFFFEILEENSGNYVLHYIKNPQYYYLKLANQPKAIYLGDIATFGIKAPEKVKKLFDEYVKCPALNFSEYDTKTKEGLLKVLEDYAANCNR